MRTHRLSLLLTFSILAVVAALPAEAQPGYCGYECSYYPPRAACSQPCLNCPGTCIEYPDVGCPDCAYWTTCGEMGYLCLSVAPVEPLLLEAPVLTGPDATAAPGLARQAPATLSVWLAGQARCARKSGS